MKKETIENVIGVMCGDVWVNVDIQFKEIMPTRTVEEKIVLDKVNSELGVLAYQIKNDIKEKINNYFKIH